MVHWDIEWIDDNGAPLEQQQRLDRETAEQQAQQWIEKKPDSRVYLYRRRGATTVLVQIIEKSA